MDIQEINKSIGQMRTLFGFLAVVDGLGIVLNFLSLGNASSDSGGFLACVFIFGILGLVIFSRAYSGLGRRDKSGYQAAKVASQFFLLGFPVGTIFGAIYLSKLAKPEFKQAFGIDV